MHVKTNSYPVLKEEKQSNTEYVDGRLGLP